MRKEPKNIYINNYLINKIILANIFNEIKKEKIFD